MQCSVCALIYKLSCTQTKRESKKKKGKKADMKKREADVEWCVDKVGGQIRYLSQDD